MAQFVIISKQETLKEEVPEISVLRSDFQKLKICVRNFETIRKDSAKSLNFPLHASRNKNQ